MKYVVKFQGRVSVASSKEQAVQAVNDALQAVARTIESDKRPEDFVRVWQEIDVPLEFHFVDDVLLPHWEAVAE